MGLMHTKSNSIDMYFPINRLFPPQIGTPPRSVMNAVSTRAWEDAGLGLHSMIDGIH